MINQKSKFKKTILLLLLLPITLLAVKTIVDLRKSAFGKPANIIINTNLSQGQLNQSLWQNLAQGGEEATNMIASVVTQTKALSPKLIRVDHIFDHHSVYISDNNYDFSKLDQIIDTILATGAKPMLSLSYTPAQLTTDGQVATQPTDWAKWDRLVFATAKRYSVTKNISGIYYEVWNEPDLFGGWHYAKQPSYSNLYYHTATAVKNAVPARNYKIGGPATTNFYPNWIKALFELCQNKHLPLDFISWHQYDKNIDKYNQNIEKLNDILSDYPQFFGIDRIITEFGPNTEPDSWYDNSISGIHLMSAITQLSGKIHRLFTFEIVDGPEPRSNNSTGWGLFTHPSKGQVQPKPRALALKLLNQLAGQRLNSTGDGFWVTSLTTKNQNTIQTLLVNYDKNNRHTETFPVTFQAITPGRYTLKSTTYMGQTNQKTINPTQTVYTEQVYMQPNTAILMELIPNN